MKYRTLFFFWSVVQLCFSCSELVHTQTSAPTLKLEREEMFANGSDQMLITAKVENQLSTRQRLKFSTTAGTLLILPQSAVSKEADSSVLINPGTTEMNVILKSSLEPVDKVFVSASIGSFTSSKIVKFSRSCPDEIKMNTSARTILLNENLDVELLLLRGDRLKVSSGLRLDCRAEPGDVVQVNAVHFSNDDGKCIIPIRALKPGDFVLLLTDLSGCNTPVEDLAFSVID